MIHFPEKQPVSAKAAAWLLPACLSAGVALAWFLIAGLGWPREQAFMAGILVVAATLWVTEAVPLFATSLFVIAAEIFLLANPGGWPGFGFATGEGTSLRAVLNAAVDPILVLFFAGFLLARAAVTEGVDQAMASWLLRPFTQSRPALLFGVMGVTALFSMWMSNTATAAFMLTLTMPLLAQVAPVDPFRKALLLAVPFAANIGGLGTPIASPPNAIAVGYLNRLGHHVGFLDWMLVAIPLLLIMLALTGWLLLRHFHSASAHPSFVLPAPRLTRRGLLVVGIFSTTVVLWMTEPLHGLSASAVALLPVAALPVLGLIKRSDVNGIDWDVLLLIAGGLALGFGLESTGLDQRLVSLLPGAGGVGLLFAAMILLVLILSTFLSNTAVANLFLPIGLAAVATRPEASPVAIALGIALMSSLSMSLPISTPPNAMAYARGELTTPDMVRIGVRAGLAGAILIIGGGLLLM